MTLRDLEIGSSAIITVVGGEGALRQHFLDMGVDIGRGSNIGKIRTDGRPDGTSHSWA